MVVPEDLDDRSLAKARGEVELPLHIRWSGPSITYDLNDRADRARVYEQVLREGTGERYSLLRRRGSTARALRRARPAAARPASMGRLAPASWPRVGIRSPRRGSTSATVPAMSESLVVTIVYEQGDDGWVVASIPEVPGAHSQGRTREEARANVIDALRGILELRFGKHPDISEGTDSEPLELVIGA